jgi:apolipoprotein N-acyltransferase
LDTKERIIYKRAFHPSMVEIELSEYAQVQFGSGHGEKWLKSGRRRHLIWTLAKLSLNREWVVRPLLAVGGGLLLSVAFPGVGIAGAAWLAPGVLLGAGLGGGGRRAFWMGYLGGVAHFLSTLYWLVSIPYAFHGIPVGPAFGWLALSAYCAVYPAVWVWLCWRIWPASAGEKILPMRAALDRFYASSVLERCRWAFCAALIWVALEMVRGRFLTGFPWNYLGVSQYKMLPVIQIAAFTGVYGVSFLMVWTSVSLVVALVGLTRQPGRGVWSEAGLPLLAAAGVAVFGASKVTSIAPAEEEMKVALVQPNLPPSWTTNAEEAGFEKLMTLSEEALADKASLLIWPEGGMGSLTQEHLEKLARLGARHGVWLVACAEDAEVSPRGQEEYYNSSVLFNPAGGLEGVYHKRRLVIFGEYVPVWLGFLKWVTPINGAFTPGTELVQFELKNPAARVSTLICFEDTFPEEAREHVTADTDFLVNLTDDGWFGDGVEPWQHAANAVFRAVENGVPLVRCTNTGLTCWIDAQGRMRKIFAISGNIHGAGFMTAKIPLRRAGDGSRTYYNRKGDWFGWSCCGLSACLFAGTLRRRSGFRKAE